MQHQPSINAPSIIPPNEDDPNTTNIPGLQQSPVEDNGVANDHYESTHDSDGRNELEVIYVVLNILFHHIYLISTLCHYFLIL